MLPIYKLSFLYVALCGWLIVMVVGSIVSMMTGSTDLDALDSGTLTPLVAKWHRKRQALRKAAKAGSSAERLDRVSISTISLAGNYKQA